MLHVFFIFNNQKNEFFQKEVDEAEISGNLDAPEGGFDAVVQALTCNVSVIISFLLLVSLLISY